MAIKNIIFDVGKVLVSYEPMQYLRSLGFDEKIVDAVGKAIFFHPLWEEGDAGTYEMDEYLPRYIANAPEYEKEIRLAYERMGDVIELFPYAVDWIKGLKERGYRIYILSNYSEYVYEFTKSKLRFLEYADGAVFSYAVKMIKPQEDIYEYLMRTYGLYAAESVFIDDRTENIEGAMKCGIFGILFTDYETTKKNLEEFLK